MTTVKMFQTTPRIIMGSGSVAGIPAEARRYGAGKVMLVTDKGLVEAGIVEPVEKALAAVGMTVERFDSVDPDPRYEIAAEAAKVTRDFGADVVLALGGGSPIDIAKVAAALVVNDDPVQSYFGIDMLPKPGLPTIVVPTTAGTGSEVTPIAILSDESEKLKKGIVSPHLFPKSAILDPDLTLELPSHVTAATGMDALIHAIEAYTSKNAYSMSDMCAEQAILLISDNLRTAFANGKNIEARAKMMEGSLLAGMAFANAGVTAVHAFAYPIGAEFHVPHGIANSIMLASVMEFNMLGNLAKFARMAELLGENTEGLSQRDAALVAVEAMACLAADVKIPQSLGEFGIKDEHIPGLAQGVMKVTRLLDNNPRELTVSDAEEIYRRVL
jgi:alcohol dehydrogenase class IV